MALISLEFYSTCRYNGDGVLNAFTKLFNVGNLGEKRANHGDELCYLFR